MALRNKIFLACESLLRVPPLLVIDEIFRQNFGTDKFSYPNDGVLSSEIELMNSNQSNLEVVSTNTNVYSSGYGISLQKSLVDAVTGFISTIQKETESTTTQSVRSIENNWNSQHYAKVEFSGWDFSTTSTTFIQLLNLFQVFGYLYLFGAVLVVFFLSTKNLMRLYSHVLAFSSIYISYYFTPLPVTNLNWSTYPSFTLNIVIRLILGGIYFFTRIWPSGYPKNHWKEVTNLFKVFDGLMFSLFFITGIIHFTSPIYIILVIILQTPLWLSIPKLYQYLTNSWEETRRIRNEYGISHLIQVETGRLRINSVFRLFWISRALYDGFYQLPEKSLIHAFRYVMTNGSETLPGIIGLTVTVSAVAHQIGAFLLWILYHGTNSESDVNRFGSISTVLFFILCLQTGLTSLDPEKRLDRLMKNIVLLATALFHALHQMVVPLLHAFRSFQILQIRAVVVSLVFLFFSIWSSIIILRSSILSTWSVAVLALAFEFKIKIIVTLLISILVYFSQLVEYPEVFQRFGQNLREILPNGVTRFFAQLHDEVGHEDVIFYLKSFSHSAEFITGIFLFFNAIWIFLFESASTIRAIGMGIHAYFNIWCEGKKGWRIYCQRRTASKKIESLADASYEQLAQRRDDVCAICYEEMESAKVTLCGHLFHAVCLRKWLYVQNTCPLCHEILYAEEVMDDEEPLHQNENLDQIHPFPAPGQVEILDNNSNEILGIIPPIPIQIPTPPVPNPSSEIRPIYFDRLQQNSVRRRLFENGGSSSEGDNEFENDEEIDIDRYNSLTHVRRILSSPTPAISNLNRNGFGHGRRRQSSSLQRLGRPRRHRIQFLDVSSDDDEFEEFDDTSTEISSSSSSDERN